jgi:hypothetical protein
VVKSPEVAALHKMLSRMDRKVKTAGLQRDINETLNSFALKVRSRDSGDGLWMGISDWYVEYAQLRYCRTICPERMRRLARMLQDSL